MYSYSSLPFRMLFSYSQAKISSPSSTSTSTACAYSESYSTWLTSVGTSRFGVMLSELACLSAYSWASFAFSSASACLKSLRCYFSSLFCSSSASFCSFRFCSITVKPCFAFSTIYSSLSWFCISLILSILRKSLISAVILFISSLDLLSSSFSIIFLLLSKIFFQ